MRKEKSQHNMVSLEARGEMASLKVTTVSKAAEPSGVKTDQWKVT